MKIVKNEQGLRVDVATLNYGDALLYDNELCVIVNDCCDCVSDGKYPNTYLNLLKNTLGAFANGTMVVPVNSTITYEFK